MSNYLKLLVGLLIGFSPLAWTAIPITQIEPWSSEQNYQRGDLVEYQQTAYIALLASKNIKPKKISVLWRPLQLSSTTPPKSGRLYLLGAVVAQGDSKYIAKKLNILHTSSDLQDSEKWIAYSGKSPFPDPSNDDPIQQLLGEDKNNNGVRDDFEELILNSELAERTKQHALQAGKAYSSTMKLSTVQGEVTAEQAQVTMQLMIHAYRCKIQIAKEEGQSWRESDFYNGIDRLEVKFIFSSFLDQLAGDDYPYEFPADACLSLALMTEGES